MSAADLFDPEAETRDLADQKQKDEPVYRKQIEYLFARSEFYREKFKAAGFKTPESVGGLDDLRHLPFTVKDELRASQAGHLPLGKQLAAPLDDVVRIYERVLVDDALSGVVLSGVVNGVAPQEQTNSEFTKALGAALHRPTVMPLPGFALKLIMGGEKASETALISQRVVPQALLDAGFEFTHPKIDSAIEAALAS